MHAFVVKYYAKITMLYCIECYLNMIYFYNIIVILDYTSDNKQ